MEVDILKEKYKKNHALKNIHEKESKSLLSTFN